KLINALIMKKNLLLSIILYFFIGISYSQDYHKFLNNSSWTYQISYMDWIDTFKILNLGDTFINNKKYEMLFDTGYRKIYYLREDVASKKVYSFANNQD